MDARAAGKGILEEQAIRNIVARCLRVKNRTLVWASIMLPPRTAYDVQVAKLKLMMDVVEAEGWTAVGVCHAPRPSREES